MATISVSLPEDGTTADVSDYNTPITTVVNAINGNIDNDNIKAAAAISGSKIADASITGSKIATYKSRLQSVTTDTTETALTLQEGWSFVTGTGTGSVSKAITFPSAFTTLKNFKIGMLAAKITSDPTAITDFNIAINGDIVMASFSSLSASGVTVNVTAENGRTLGSGVRFGLWWEAKGVI